MTARDDLEAARTLAATRSESTDACWPRATAVLARRALDGAMDSLWEVLEPGMVPTRSRTKYTYLPFVIGDETLGREAHWTWTRLSQACHHDAYELPPTAGELAGLLDGVERVIEGVDRRVAARFASAERT